jgi:phosphonatase-like hydrolase
MEDAERATWKIGGVQREERHDQSLSLPIELAIFDIAGTLIEDHNEVADAFLEALRANYIEVTDDEIKEWKGSSKRQVITYFVERQFGRCRNLPLIDRTYSEFRFNLEQRYGNGGIVKIAGAEEALDWLCARKIKLATTTGFYREVRDRILCELNWETRFDVNVCSDDVANGRPAPDMINMVMKQTGISDAARVLTIGDTPLDLQSGTAAKCGMVVGVLTGMHTPERLRREPHTQLISSVADIPSLFE